MLQSYFKAKPILLEVEFHLFIREEPKSALKMSTEV